MGLTEREIGAKAAAGVAEAKRERLVGRSPVNHGEWSRLEVYAEPDTISAMRVSDQRNLLSLQPIPVGQIPMTRIRVADTLGFWTLLGIAAGAMTGIVAIVLGLNTGPIDEGILMALLGVVLVFDLPVCLFLLWDWASSGKVPELPLGRLLWQLLPLADIYDERAFQHTLSLREDLTGDEFYQRYYQGLHPLICPNVLGRNPQLF